MDIVDSPNDLDAIIAELSAPFASLTVYDAANPIASNGLTKASRTSLPELTVAVADIISRLNYTSDLAIHVQLMEGALKEASERDEDRDKALGELKTALEAEKATTRRMSAAIEALGEASRQVEEGDEAFESDAFKAAVKKVMEEVDRFHKRPGGPRKKADKALANLAKYIVHLLVHKRHSRKGRKRFVDSSSKLWEHGTTTGKVEISLDQRKKMIALRPGWGNKDHPGMKLLLSEGTARMVATVVPDGTPEGKRYDEETCRLAIKTYAANIFREYKKQPGMPDANVLKAKGAKNRMTQKGKDLHAAMLKVYADSPLPKSREGDWLLQALINNISLLEQYTRDGQIHGLSASKKKDVADKGDDADQDGEEEEEADEGEDDIGDVDEYTIYSDLWQGQNGDDHFFAVDQSWWSPTFRLAFWVLFEFLRAQPKKKQFQREPIAHLPESKWSAELPDGRSLNIEGTAAAEVDGGKTMWFCQSMVQPGPLPFGEDVEAAFRDSVYPDPPVTKPTALTLKKLLETTPNKKLKLVYAAAKNHLRVVPSLADDDLDELWVARAEGIAASNFVEYGKKLAKFAPKEPRESEISEEMMLE